MVNGNLPAPGRPELFAGYTAKDGFFCLFRCLRVKS
jgi:hypothetical protein